jgi:hypothetical protein
MSTSSVKISPVNFPSTRTVPSNDSFPSNSLPLPSKVVTGWALPGSPDVGDAWSTSWLLGANPTLQWSRPSTREASFPNIVFCVAVFSIPRAHPPERGSAGGIQSRRDRTMALALPMSARGLVMWMALVFQGAHDLGRKSRLRSKGSSGSHWWWMRGAAIACRASRPNTSTSSRICKVAETMRDRPPRR